MNILRHIIEPGFFGSGPVHIALAVGTVVAVTSAVTGVFTVTRGQSFVYHSLADIATTGGSGAFLVSVNQFWGYLAFGAGARTRSWKMIGIQRAAAAGTWPPGVVLGAGPRPGRAVLVPGHPVQHHDRRLVHDLVRLDLRLSPRPPCPP